MSFEEFRSPGERASRLQPPPGPQGAHVVATGTSESAPPLWSPG